MLEPAFFIEELAKHHLDFFAGVPDSLLKNICAYIADHTDAAHNIIAANEGAAVGLAVGHFLATGQPGVVYMQNSGEGNAINPLVSLADKDVYHIPMLLLIGWRGRPGVHDEPQHVKQGKITTGLLNTLGIDYDVLSTVPEKAVVQLQKAAKALRNNELYALVVEKGTFADYQLQQKGTPHFPMSREKAIQAVAAAMDARDAAVSTTGMISRELFETRVAWGQSNERDFLTVGGMGHASQIALGIALAQPQRRVWCLDGDGATLMHMGSMAIVADKKVRNLVHVVFNNGAHDSVGGQPTVGLSIDLPAIAHAVGYRHIYSVSEEQELARALAQVKQAKKGPVFLEVKVHKGNRKDLGRPTSTPAQNKESLMAFLSK